MTKLEYDRYPTTHLSFKQHKCARRFPSGGHFYCANLDGFHITTDAGDKEFEPPLKSLDIRNEADRIDSMV